MKNIVKYIGIAALGLGILAACSPEEVIHPSEAGIVSAQNYEPVISVDQETNQVTFSVDAKSVIPVWVFADKNGEWTQYSAQNGLQKIFASMGDYQVRMYIMNASGISPDYKEGSFHINNTIMSFDKYLTFIAGGKDGGSSKEWRIDNDVQGHLGCGEPGTDGTNWWSAAANDKKDFGVYDDRLTFTGGYAYTYDPGEGGTVYVNKDVTVAPFGDYRNPDEDYMVPVDRMDATYSFEVVGDDLYLVLPEGTLFPYIANDDFVADPRFRIQSITAKAMELVIDNGAISWHYTLTSGAAAQVFNGFKYNSEFNIWKKSVDDGSNFEFISTYYAHGGSWEANPDEITYDYSGSTLTVTLPDESDQRWQAQLHIGFPELEITSAKNYDFSCIIQSNNTFLEGTGVTFKIVDKDNDGLFLIEPVIPVESAYEDIIYYVSDVPGVDIAKGNVKVAFDFGGCRAGTELTIKNIVLKDHADDDGTVLPSDDPEPAPVEEGAHYDVDNAATNFWLNSDVSVVFWYADGGWSQIADPAYEWLNGDQKDFKVTIPEGIGGSEWQGQTHFTVDHAVEAAGLYDFCATLNASSDFTCTVKLAWEGNDNDHAFFYVNDFAVTAFEDCTFKMPKIAPDVDYDKVALFFDFGRTPSGTEITISDVCIQEHQEPQGGGDDPGTDVTGTELWDNSQVSIVYWYANSGWSQIGDPDCASIEGGWSFVMPAEIGGSEWQGQTHFTMPVAVSAAKTYQFKVTLNSSEDCTCTVKLAWEGNDNDHAFFYDNAVALTSYEDVVYVQYPISPDVDYDKVALFVDLGRTPAGATVEIKDISLIEVSEPVDIWDNSQVSIVYWYANSGWSQIGDPECASIEGGWSFVMPAEIGGSEWQGQTHFTMPAPAYASKTYDFSVTINSSEDCTCTVKLAWEGNDNDHAFFYDNAVALTAYEDVTYTQKGVFPDVDYDKIALFVDLGRTPAGATVEIKDIHLIEK